MKLTKSSHHHRGFTLVELLVVISIIAVLMGIAFPIAMRVKETAKKTSARTCMGQLVLACDSFYENYQYLPMSNTSSVDDEQETDNQFMAPLLGLRIAQDENPQFQSFFKFQLAEGKGEDAYNGLVRTDNRAELLGPWLNKSKNDRYYIVVLNYDNDNQLRPPNEVGAEPLFDRRAIVYHKGKDGKAGGKYNEDNVYSWNKDD